MNVIFLAICSLSVLFFAVFLVECSRPSRKAKKTPVARKSTEADVIDSAAGRRFLAHLEQQMAELLSHHGQTAAVLLLALALAPAILGAQTGPSLTGQGDDPTPPNSAPGLSSLSEQNSSADPGSTQASSDSSNGVQPAGANDPSAGTDPAAASSSALHGNFFSRLGQAYMQDCSLS